MWVLILRGTYCVSVCAHCLCPASVHHEKEPASIFHLLMLSHEAFIQDIKISSKLPPVQIDQSQIFHSILTITVTGGPELDPVCQTWPHQPFIKGKPFNFHLLAVLCLRKPRISSGFFVASAHHRLIDSFMLERSLSPTFNPAQPSP